MWLASDDADYMNGITLFVDGGMLYTPDLRITDKKYFSITRDGYTPIRLYRFIKM